MVIYECLCAMQAVDGHRSFDTGGYTDDPDASQQAEQYLRQLKEAHIDVVVIWAYSEAFER